MQRRVSPLLLVAPFLLLFACSLPVAPSPGAAASSPNPGALSVETDANRNQGVLVTGNGSTVDVEATADDGTVVNCVDAVGVASVGAASGSKSISSSLAALIVGTRNDGGPGAWMWASGKMQAVMDADSGRLSSKLSEASDNGGIFRGAFGWVYYVMGISEDGAVIVGYAENQKGISLGTTQVDPGTTVGVYWQVSRHPILHCFVASRAHIIGTLDQSKLQNLSGRAGRQVSAGLRRLLGQLKLLLQGYYNSYLVMVEKNGVHFDKPNSVYLVTGTDQDDNPAIATIDQKGSITIAPIQSQGSPNVVPGSLVGTGSSVAEGGTLAVSLVLQNPQSTSVTQSFGVDFHLATTSIFNPTSDTLLGSSTVNTTIAAGSSYKLTTSFTMPTVSSPNQDFYLYAVVGSNVSTVADAAVVLVYDSSNGSRTYNVILQTYDPTSPTTNLTGGTSSAEVDTIVAYYKLSSGVGVYQAQADPGGPGYGYKAIGSISSPLSLGPGTYYVLVLSYTGTSVTPSFTYGNGPYAMAVITGNIALQPFPTALTQDPYTTDGTPQVYPIYQNLNPSVSPNWPLPTHPVQMNLGSMVNRYSASGAWDWFTFTLP